ncbi:uncharacterized protein LOC119446092 isoform X4 [Dermacentor silvarum]|uniref:uncharacterized protein LOC119446092 isoform X4 n=1 Tax=Dermacentor silvarum TaxID=543639 RepID=UPI00189BE4A4|nr:uncharacterized protein LOC119446092 isoform X4 [Dermacentor silvarum]
MEINATFICGLLTALLSVIACSPENKRRDDTSVQRHLPTHQVPPVLNCRFTCDNQKDNERYEMEKDGTPCHLHRRVRSLIGVCVRGHCQQNANK